MLSYFFDPSPGTETAILPLQSLCCIIQFTFQPSKPRGLRWLSQICLVSVNRPTDLKTRKTRDSELGVKPFEEFHFDHNFRKCRSIFMPTDQL